MASRLWLVRVALPVAILIAGIVLIVFGDEFAQGAGIVLVGVAPLVVLANLLIRLSFHSNRERDEEEAARRYYDEHGRWPDAP